MEDSERYDTLKNVVYGLRKREIKILEELNEARGKEQTEGDRRKELH